jgi:hypothetical protein
LLFKTRAGIPLPGRVAVYSGGGRTGRQDREAAGGILITGKNTDLLMQKNLAVFCILFLLCGVFLSGCVSNDDKFGNTVSEMGSLTQPEMNSLNDAIKNHDANASQYHCRQLVTIIDTYNPRLSAIRVSEKYQPSKQRMIAGFDNQKKGCELLINSSSDNPGPSMEYFAQSTNDFDWVVRNWPE